LSPVRVDQQIKKDNFFSIQQKLTKALKAIPKDSYDVIIANHSLTTYPVLRAGVTKKTLYYIQAYEPEMYRLMGGAKNYILSFLSLLSYKIKLFTVVNADVYTNHKWITSKRVLYPGVDFGLFYSKNTNAEDKKSADKIIIGTIGRLEVFKGTIYILQAFSIIKQKFPNAELHVAFGDADDFKEYKDIYCFQPHGDEALGDFYRSLDYYICAGFIQLGAFHYPVAEAMSCGVSVITTSYYPANDTNAWITKPRDPEDIAEKFSTAHENMEQRKQKIKKGFEAVQQFDWKVVTKKLNFFLEELVAKNN
jgi:glycosyltransferase involved in cell wall biosynthesis